MKAERLSLKRKKPGPLATKARKTATVLDLLRVFESRNVTFIEPDGSWPVVWERARGVHVWDLEGKRYLDLTAAFGVAAAGHANPRVVAAGQIKLQDGVQVAITGSPAPQPPAHPTPN